MTDARVGRARPDSPLPAGSLESIGSRLREARLALGISLREMARRISVSPSFVSQVELGKARPSVGTLYAFVSELDLSLDDLMTDPASGPVLGAAGDGRQWSQPAEPFPWPMLPSPVQAAAERKTINLPGVMWQRLTSQDDPMVEFLHVTYEPGGESCPKAEMIRHGGHEYGHVITGLLEVQIDDEIHEIGPGDSVHFDSARPHRLCNIGDVASMSIWVVVGRRVDLRMIPSELDPHERQHFG